MSEQLPFLVEYAKSGRAGCKACKNPIAKDSLRIAKLVQSPFHDGMMTNWFHEKCFWSKARPQQIGDISNFDNIRFEDQEMIKKKLEEQKGNPEPSSSSGKGRKRDLNSAFKDYKLDYAKSNRSICVGCEAPIIKGSIRISKMDYESEKGARFGGIDRWHHAECFAKLRETYQFFATANVLPGYKILTSEDQATLNKLLPKIAEAEAPKIKIPKTEPEDEKEQEKLKKQSEKLFQIKDQLKELKKKEIGEMLTYNSQYIPEGQAEMIETLADQMIFGSLSNCKKCSGQFIFTSGLGYKCTGNLTEWTKCEEVTQSPKRKPFKIPSNLKEKYDFLKEFKPKVSKRFIKITAPSTSKFVKKEETEKSGPLVDKGPLPLRGMQFVIVGKTKKPKDKLKEEIMLLGGTVTTKVNENTSAVIGTHEAIEAELKAIQDARAFDIQVVSEDFVDAAKDYTSAPISLIEDKNISDWGDDPSSRVAASTAKSMSRGKSMYEKSKSGKVKLRVKGGGAVDPLSGLEDTAHVYMRGNEKFTVTLGLTDIQANVNKFYKLQILKDDKSERYWLFRSWGRIGTSIGGTKLERDSREDCIKQFEHHYYDKTGNRWSNRNSFVKQPKMMYPMDVDDCSDDTTVDNLESKIESKLEKPVQDLIKLIFDVNIMKQVMKEYELDSDKMPLGKLSKSQLQKAFAVLSEVQELMKQSTPERAKIVDATNRFYTLVPHSFGVSNPPLLDNNELIKAKCEMIESLIDMEIAYSLLNVKTDEDKSPLDAHYEQLNTNISVLDKESDEFKMIQTYTKNTHAATHSGYELEIKDVFVIKRNGEDKRFKPFKKLPNRKLLWHGSRTTNFAGILSQGLRIAPPEAPVTGYMFGKGIYFADMVSKSANYCCTNHQNPTGLLMLCEVALGNMYERLMADYIEKLPNGKHSTFGAGQTCPDPQMAQKIKDGVEVPLGTPIPTNKNSSLLYNEYIVYDVAQVQAQYLVRTNFKFKY